jgi:hypothetical protein
LIERKATACVRAQGQQAQAKGARSMANEAPQDFVTAELQRIAGGAPVAAVAIDGVVTLTGVVRDETRRALIEQEVLGLPGVTDVRNHLHVPLPAGPPADQLRVLFEKAKIDAGGIVASVAGDVVTLTGDAPSWFDRDAAERLAWMLPGVRRVDNRVALPAGTFDPEDDSADPVIV